MLVFSSSTDSTRIHNVSCGLSVNDFIRWDISVIVLQYFCNSLILIVACSTMKAVVTYVQICSTCLDTDDTSVNSVHLQQNIHICEHDYQWICQCVQLCMSTSAVNLYSVISCSISIVLDTVIVNNAVLNDCLKSLIVCDLSRRSCHSAFHVVRPATEKARRLNVFWRYRGTVISGMHH